MPEQIARIPLASALAGDAERLAREARRKRVNMASIPRSGESSHIRPDGSVGEKVVSDAGAQDSRGVLAVFDVADGAQLNSEHPPARSVSRKVKLPAPGKQRDAVEALHAASFACKIRAGCW